MIIKIVSRESSVQQHCCKTMWKRHRLICWSVSHFRDFTLSDSQRILPLGSDANTCQTVFSFLLAALIRAQHTPCTVYNVTVRRGSKRVKRLSPKLGNSCLDISIRLCDTLVALRTRIQLLRPYFSKYTMCHSSESSAADNGSTGIDWFPQRSQDQKLT